MVKKRTKQKVVLRPFIVKPPQEYVQIHDDSGYVAPYISLPDNFHTLSIDQRIAYFMINVIKIKDKEGAQNMIRKRYQKGYAFKGGNIETYDEKVKALKTSELRSRLVYLLYAYSGAGKKTSFPKIGQHLGYSSHTGAVMGYQREKRRRLDEIAQMS